MHKGIAVLSIFFLVAAGWAGDQAPPAGSATPGAIESASRVFSWYGMAQFRLGAEVLAKQRRTDSLSIDDFWLNSTSWEDSIQGVNERSRSTTISYILAYKLGVKVKPHDQVLIQVELGNDWIAKDTLNGIPGSISAKRGIGPRFSSAYAQWDPGFVHIAAGIIPLKETCLIDLLQMSILNNRNYAQASQIEWDLVNNFRQFGLHIGAPVLKGDFKVDIDFMTAIIENGSISRGFDLIASNTTAFEYLVEVPMAFGGFTATPQLFGIPNRSLNPKTGKGDMEFGGGMEFGITVNKSVTLRGGIGYAENSNRNSFYYGESVQVNPFNQATSITRDTLYKMAGVNSSLGSSMFVGPGKLDIDVRLSTNRNTKTIPMNSDGIYPFADVKYGFPVYKNFMIMPRCRLFMSRLKSKYVATRTIFPELIFNGFF